MSAEVLTALQGPNEADAAAFRADAPVSGVQGQIPKIPEVLSILPVRGFVVFPGTVAPLNVRRATSIKLLDETLPISKVIGLIAQRDETKEDPEPRDLY